MANKLYIIATEARSGKSVVALGLLQLLLRNVRKVAFFRPIIRESRFPGTEDADIALMRSQFGLEQSYTDSYVYTLTEARELINSGKQAHLLDTVLKKFRELEENYEFVLCMGTDLSGQDGVFEFDLNAEIAANLGAPVLMVANGAKKSPKEITDSAHATLELMDEKGLDVLACVVNLASVSKKEADGIAASFSSPKGGAALPVYILPEDPSLLRPTVAELCQWLGAEVMYGRERMDAPVTNYLVAAMHISNFLEHLGQGDLVITPGDRNDILLASLAARHSVSFASPSAVLLTGGIETPKAVCTLLEGLQNVQFPVLRVKDHTYKTIQRLGEFDSGIKAGDTRKINSALGHFERHINSQDLGQRIVDRKSVKITPKMFEFNLMERAKRNKMRIVLPEGTEERILRATEILSQRGVAEIILLGEETAIRNKIRDLGLEFEPVIIEPEKSPQFDDYVDTYQELRKAKNITRGMARDAMLDNTYYGTMMVYKGHADGMVSGSVNTTAHTIRPAFEFVKTKPGVSIVSSIFLMCLKDRVLAFGDCAVNPNPTPEQLASIAISSAHTAKVFGIEPRVAMLSYSTGTSGKGADVDSVVEAVKIAKEKAPDLLLEGPLQYDAAIDPDVARTKLPDSQVAGKATVFIFPDLNTGNNTYKAVQRAANAVAIGPVLQGLNKPVNDLSRGCTVPDIVNTVAITAIQAQAENGLE